MSDRLTNLAGSHEHWLELRRQAWLGAAYLDQQTPDGYAESPSELAALNRLHQGALERDGDLRRKTVEFPAEKRLQSEAAAGQTDNVVTERVDDVLGLPDLAALDARPRMEHMVAAEPDEVRHRRLRGALPFDHLAEDGSKVRSKRTEFGCWSDREVNLKAARKKEDAIDGRARAQIEEV